jgi:hypothetical protein
MLLPVVFICASLQITTDFTDSRHVGPDEEMRYFMPEFIYENNRLPTGYETETWGNWSYGFYPQFLGAMVSTVFMWIVSIFPHDGDTLIRAARLASVLFGVIAAVFIRNTARLMFRKHKHRDAISNLAMVLFALLPQVAFLSSYVNNDIVALAGVSIITYACVHAYIYGAKLANALYYAAGASIAMLGYLNSYGFVLVGFIFLLMQLLKDRNVNRAFVLKYLLISIGITALVTLPFLIRNGILYDGDILGLSTFRSEYQRWLDSGGFPMQSPYAGGLYNLLFGTSWAIDTLNSMTFGYFATWGRGVASVQYWPYHIGGVIASVGAVFAYKASRKDKSKNVLVALLALGSAITLALCFYYTLMIDYQPQGRYIIYLIVPIVLGMVYGINYILQKITRPKYLTVTIYSICLVYVALYFSVAYQTLLT